MLQKLTTEIRECYRHAEECRRRARQTLDPAVKQDFLDMEQRWLSLARSYELSEKLSSFTQEMRRRLYRGPGKVD